MALSYTKPHFPLAITTCLLLLLSTVNSAESLSFNYRNFWSNSDDITFQGHASSRAGTLQLTPTDDGGNPIRQSAGHALYSEPFSLKGISFLTKFDFVVKTTAPSPADGFAIFVAPTDFPVKRYGGYLGLFDTETATNTSKNKVVAVEFDTWVNTEFDPRYRHIGIDVNSIESVATTRWQDKDVFSGSVATAQIGYDGSSKILTVFLSYPDGGNYVLSHAVDFDAIFQDEKIRIGFSGATGQYETQYILSWSFSSSPILQSDSNCKIFKRSCPGFQLQDI